MQKSDSFASASASHLVDADVDAESHFYCIIMYGLKAGKDLEKMFQKSENFIGLRPVDDQVNRHNRCDFQLDLSNLVCGPHHAPRT